MITLSRCTKEHYTVNNECRLRHLLDFIVMCRYHFSHESLKHNLCSQTGEIHELSNLLAC